MDDHIDSDQARLGDRIVLAIIGVLTMPLWLGALIAAFR